MLGGSSETHNAGKGAFQEVDAIALLSPLAKAATRPPYPEMIPAFIKDAYRTAMFGRPGPTFVDLPADYILGHFEIEHQKLTPLTEVPLSVAPDNKIQDVVKTVKSAKAPLVVIGKGAAYAGAEHQIRALINQYDRCSLYPFFSRQDYSPLTCILGLACHLYRRPWPKA